MNRVLSLLVVCVLVWWGEGKQPELIDSSVWYSPNATLLNVNFDAAIVQMVRIVFVMLYSF